MTIRNAAVLALALVLVASGGALAQALRFDFAPEHMNPVRPGTPPGMALFEAERAAAAPRMEASPGDPAWRDAAELADFGIEEPPTRTRLAYDDLNLYVLVICENDPHFTPQAEERPRDHSMHGDDHVHFVVNTAPGRGLDHLFKVNMAGAIYDARGADEAWNPEWRSAVRQEDDRWFAEAALPWAIFGLDGPPGRIGFNIGRSGNGVIIRSWNNVMHYSAAASALVLEGAGPDGEGEAEAAPVASSPTVTVHGASLAVDLPRPYARPEDRWLDATLHLRPQEALENTRIKASLHPLGGGEPLETASAVPGGDAGRLSVDLRSHNLAAAEVSLEYYEGGRRTAVGRMFLTVRSAANLLAGRRVEVSVDVPEGVPAPELWPVTFGMPFPRGSLWDAERLRLVDGAGRELPSQAEASALWSREGAVKWMRFEAVVDPAGGCFVEFGAPSAAPEAPVRVGGHANGRLALDTGAVRYVLGAGASPVEEIWLEGRRVAASEGARGLYVVDQNGRLGVSSAEGMDVRVEADGPVAASVRFEGWYRDAEGAPMARHITRVEAFAGQPFANVTHTLVITEDTNEVWFKEAGWEFSAAPGAAPRAVFNVDRADPSAAFPVALADGASAYMFQEEHRRFGAGENRFRVASGGEVLHEGEACGDWALLAGEAGGLLMSCKEAARQHPKEFNLSADRFNLLLFSNRTGEEMDFRGETLAKKWNLTGDIAEAAARQSPNAAGWSKTHELLLAPLPAAEAEAKAAHYAGLRSNPVYALADPQWIFESDAMGPVPPRDRERWPELEGLIDEVFHRVAPRGHETGHYGFMDYFAGPCYSGGPGPCRAGRYRSTYGLRNSVWLAYARSGERAVREFAEGTNKAFLDNYLIHWDAPGKVRGVYTGGGGRPLNQLPFYWRQGHVFNLSGTTNLDQFLWLYHLTGYRRAKDAVEQFGEGLVEGWEHDRRVWRQLMVFRTLVQTYGFTWDPRLRALAEGTFDSFADGESEVLLTKNRPYQRSTYKTAPDLRALVEAWRLFGEPKYLEAAKAVAEHWWRRSDVGNTVVRREPAIGHGGNLLFEETGDPAILAAMDFALRRSGKWTAGVGTSMLCSVFETLPYVMGVLARAGGRNDAALPWVAYRDYSGEASVVAHKSRDGILDFTVATTPPRIAGSREPAPVGQKMILEAVGELGRGERTLDRVVQTSAGASEARVPKDAPEGAYRVVPADSGEHFVMPHSRKPTALHAPGYWHLPDIAPALRIYFKVPEGADGAAIFFEGAAQLFDPQGRPFGDGARGWADLPADRPGLWSFLPAENRLVRARNFPPFFAFGDPEFFFEPPIEWERAAPPEPAPEIADDALFVPGAVEAEGSQALRLAGRRGFRLDSGPAHPSGDGGQFLPYRQGTIEFWFRPEWSTFDLGAGEASKRFIRVTTDKSPWDLTYRVDPEGTEVNLGPRDPSHSLYGAMRLANGARLRVWRTQTLFERGEWAHVAWSWGPVLAYGPRRERLNLMRMRIHVNGVGAGWTIFRSAVDQLAAGVPQSLQIFPLDGAIDQLRVSDVQRYEGDFAPPTRDRPLAFDEHTRALFRFDGTLQGASYGTEAPPEGDVAP